MTDREKQLEILKQSKAMMDKTIQETNFIKEKNPKKQVASDELMSGITSDVLEQMVKVNNGKLPQDYLQNTIDEEKGVIKRELPEKDKIIQPKEIKVKPSNTFIEFDTSTYNPHARYDVIPLPSNGEVYSHKKSKLPVAYLTALDENLIIQPNMYVDGIIIDTLLKNKIMDREINAEELCKGDRDAIILWLRSTGYGPEYPVTVNHPKTGEPFDTIVDLTQIKYKKFNLKGDENGWFEFTLPVSKDIIKFTYPTRRDERNYEKMIGENEKTSQKLKLNKIIEDLNRILDEDKFDLTNKEKDDFNKSINTLVQVKENIGENDVKFFNKNLTERMILLIKSVNGNTDDDFIREYVENMIAFDAKEFRKYVSENEPGLDMEIELKTPAEGGEEGESFKTFLELDIMLFLNIS